uniref:diguanylate cyclase n=1 Tax=Thermodesulfobacterium geofontis TaxID=1295609 RepID=A0A7V6CE23_9BACT
MSLKRFFLLLFIFISSFLLISYFFIFKFLESSFIFLEKEEAKKVLNKVEFYLQNEMTELHNLTKDWAAWDDAYLFMENKNSEKFVKTNLSPSTYLNLKIDLLCYTYLNGKIKAGGLFDKENSKIYLNKELLDLIKSTLENLSNRNLYNYKKLLIFMDKPFIVSIYPVLKSNYEGPPKGYLFMGRFLTSEDINTLANLFDMKELQILRSDTPSPEVIFIKANFNEIVLEKPYFLNDESLKVKINYLVGKPFVKSAIFSIVITQVSLLLVFAIIMSFLIDKYILKPLLKLLSEINDAKNKEKTRLSLEYPTKEYKDLASVINEFLENISVRENIYKAVAEKTENLIALFDGEKNIIFKNANVKFYFNSEELKHLVERISEELKNLDLFEGKLEIKNFPIKNYWFNFQIIEVFKSLYLLIGQNITEAKLKEEKLFKMATQDFLTDLYNRRYLEDTLERIMAASKRGERFVLLFIDCDDLKKINDTYGHLIGDEVLKVVAQVIKESIRREDLGSRWGGDEFVVILNHCDKDLGIKIAERIINKLENSEIKLDSVKIKPSVSIGIVEIDGTKEINEVLDLADKLAYKAKLSRKTKIMYQP